MAVADDEAVPKDTPAEERMAPGTTPKHSAVTERNPHKKLCEQRFRVQTYLQYHHPTQPAQAGRPAARLDPHHQAAALAAPAGGRLPPNRWALSCPPPSTHTGTARRHPTTPSTKSNPGPTHPAGQDTHSSPSTPPHSLQPTTPPKKQDTQEIGKESKKLGREEKKRTRCTRARRRRQRPATSAWLGRHGPDRLPPPPPPPRCADAAPTTAAPSVWVTNTPSPRPSHARATLPRCLWARRTAADPSPVQGVGGWVRGWVGGRRRLCAAGHTHPTRSSSLSRHTAMAAGDVPPHPPPKKALDGCGDQG